MTKSEFNKWLEFHQSVFPEVTDWLEQRPETVMVAWKEALSRVRYEDAMACTRKMLAGQVDHPNRFEISRLPAAIVRNTPFRIQPASELQNKTWNPTTGDLA